MKIPKRIRHWLAWAAACCLVLSLALGTGCKGPNLESGGPYAPIDAQGVAHPDKLFYAADASFKLSYSTALTACKFEKDNRAMLWKLSPDIKHAMDAARPQIVEVRDKYIAARAAYIANPVPAGLEGLNYWLAKMQQITLAVTTVLPKAK